MFFLISRHNEHTVAFKCHTRTRNMRKPLQTEEHNVLQTPPPQLFFFQEAAGSKKKSIACHKNMSLTYTFILAVKPLLILKGPDRKLNKNPIQVVFLIIYHQTPKIIIFFFLHRWEKKNQ